MFGSPETTTGGNALKFYSSLRLDIEELVKLKKWIWLLVIEQELK